MNRLNFEINNEIINESGEINNKINNKINNEIINESGEINNKINNKIRETSENIDINEKIGKKGAVHTR